ERDATRTEHAPELAKGGAVVVEMLENVQREHGIQRAAAEGQAHEARLNERQGAIAAPAVGEGRSRDVDAADPAVAPELLQPDTRAAARVEEPRPRDTPERRGEQRMAHSTHADRPPVGALDGVELVVEEGFHGPAC